MPRTGLVYDYNYSRKIISTTSMGASAIGFNMIFLLSSDSTAKTIPQIENGQIIDLLDFGSSQKLVDWTVFVVCVHGQWGDFVPKAQRTTNMNLGSLKSGVSRKIEIVLDLNLGSVKMNFI